MVSFKLCRHLHREQLANVFLFDSLQEVHIGTPVEVFNSASALPKDPILRRQELEDLMTKIHGSFSFMQVEFGWEKTLEKCYVLLCQWILLNILKWPCPPQDSLLDGEGSPTHGLPGLKRQQTESPSSLGNSEVNSLFQLKIRLVVFFQ